ncbi:DUF2938 family protein [Niveibacterium sp.]|uniref:DUF2938 family protein n=1 Tax=Niveibacterium sp. TaxID=2017444 RepID=UPI0035ADE40D
MESVVSAFVGGMAGALLMDATEAFAARLGVTSGVNVALLGRWFLSLLGGRFTHKDIRECRPFKREAWAGWAFHLLVGGGGVALLYPLFFHGAGLPHPDNDLLGGMIFGLATSLLPWFVLLPSFGWGAFGLRGPAGTNALLASPLSHIPYGLGVGVALAFARHIG